MADTLIKPDPEAPGASPAALSEEDIYEDAGDLEFNSDPVFQSLYLARVPKYLWEAWSKLDDDAEIQIGTLRHAVVKDENGQKAWGIFQTLGDVVANWNTEAATFDAPLFGSCCSPNGTQRIQLGYDRRVG
jgi:transcription initiation factor TFIIF subunit beta